MNINLDHTHLRTTFYQEISGRRMVGLTKRDKEVSSK